jgi:hypothetical protein
MELNCNLELKCNLDDIGSIHDWATKNECLIEKGLQKTTLDFCLSYIIIILVDCCMPIDKMMSS